MGAFCCPIKTSYRMNDDADNVDIESGISYDEKRRRAAEAAENRFKQQQMRGMSANVNDQPVRKAHAELPGNVDSNLKWQVS